MIAVDVASRTVVSNTIAAAPLIVAGIVFLVIYVRAALREQDEHDANELLRRTRYRDLARRPR